MFFFKLKKRFCLRLVDAAWSKVFFLRRVRLRSVDAAWSKVEFCAEYGCDRWMQRGARSSFAPSTVAIGGCSVEQGLFFAPGTVAIGGCSVEQGRVLRRVRCGIRLRPAGLRRDKVYRQITCDAPPQFEQLSQKMGQ